MNEGANSREEQLQKYLDGELQPEEKGELEAQLSADPALRDQLKDLEAAREAIRFYGLQQQVGRIHTAMMDELQPRARPAVNIRRFLRYASAVAAGVLLVIGGILAYDFFTLSPEKVFASHYQRYEIGSLRGNDSAGLSPVEDAYARNNYGEAINTWYNRPFTPRETLLRGMSYMELKQDSSAVTAFLTVIRGSQTDSASLLKNDAEYYLALAYIRLKKYNEALDLLRAIRTDKEHLYHDRVSAKWLRQVRMLKRK